jgi:hypothetical protein
MLAEAQRNLQDTNIALLRGSAENVWEIVDGDFDIITMGQVAQYLASDEIAAFVMRASNRLKPKWPNCDLRHHPQPEGRSANDGTRPPQGSAFWLRDREALRCGLRALGCLAPIAKGRTFHPDGHMYAPEFFAAIAKEERDEDRYADVDVL